MSDESSLKDLFLQLPAPDLNIFIGILLGKIISTNSNMFDEAEYEKKAGHVEILKYDEPKSEFLIDSAGNWGFTILDLLYSVYDNNNKSFLSLLPTEIEKLLIRDDEDGDEDDDEDDADIDGIINII